MFLKGEKSDNVFKAKKSNVNKSATWRHRHATALVWRYDVSFFFKIQDSLVYIYVLLLSKCGHKLLFLVKMSKNKLFVNIIRPEALNTGFIIVYLNNSLMFTGYTNE